MPPFRVYLHALNKDDFAFLINPYLEQAFAYFKSIVNVYFEKDSECMRKLLACLSAFVIGYARLQKANGTTRGQLH
jgi:hypothetical protein